MNRLITLPMLLALWAPCWGQVPAGAFRDVPELPDTPAGRHMTEFLALMNAEQEPDLKGWVARSLAPSFLGSMPAEDFVGWLGGVRSGHGKLRFVACRILENNPVPGSVLAIVHSARSDRWLGVMIGVEPDPPHRITSLVVNSARPPEGSVAAAPLTSGQLAADLRRYLESLSSREAFSGSVLVAVGDDIVFSEAYGLADRETRRPNTVETPFGLSSMGKMFTAVAIGRLVDEGRLGWDDPVSRYLGEDWMPSGAGDRLTLRHLLCHTGGTGDFLEDLIRKEDRSRFLEVSDYRKLVAGRPLAFEPGSRFSYSNSGFILLGAVIEKVTGQRYEDYVRKAVWGPAGMDSTACLDREAPSDARAIGYYRDPEKDPSRWESNASIVPRKGSPAGGCFSNVGDLYRFARALHSGKLVRPETLAEMLTLQTPEGAQLRYGLGFILSGTGSDRMAGHGGSFPGAYGELDMYLDRKATVVVLSNGEGAGSARDKARELLQRLAVP